MIDFPKTYPGAFGAPDRPYPLFMNFMLATFHQDWDLDTCGNPTVDFVSSCGDKIDRYFLCVLSEMYLLKYSKTDEELSEFFSKVLYCAYDPKVDGKTDAQWLDELIAAMEHRIYGTNARLGQIISNKE